MAEQFIDIFERLLKRERVEISQEDLSLLFEKIAQNLIAGGLAFDGAVNIASRIRKSRQVVFEGEMWFGEDLRKQRKAAFTAIMTDKRITKQGIRIKIRLGEYVGEGSLEEIFGLID